MVKPCQTIVYKDFVKIATIVLCTVGLSLSIYSIYVKILGLYIPGYKAFCDISPSVSCSRIFTSRWGKGFGVIEKIFNEDSVINQPNGVFGIAIYSCFVVMAFQNTVLSSVVQVIVAAITNVGSLYLGYVLFYIIIDACVVCITIYAINFCLLVCSCAKLHRICGQIKRKQV